MPTKEKAASPERAGTLGKTASRQKSYNQNNRPSPYRQPAVLVRRWLKAFLVWMASCWETFPAIIQGAAILCLEVFR